ncbi:MAG: molybdopterin dinucleotide binding domain-containing protein, partial [Albidovulum sp.]
LRPFLWPANPRRRGGRFFADGRFHTPDGKARMIPVVPRVPEPAHPEFPFRLNTGRIRDQWHTMTRTGLSPRLGNHLAEPFLEIHPEDAARLTLAPASLAEVTSPEGRAVLRILITDRVQPGHPFAPMHWTGETGPTGRIDAVVAARTDPVSGQPDSKGAAVAIAPYRAGWYGFAVSHAAFRPDCGYWATSPLAAGMRAELAGTEAPEDWEAEARRLFGLSSEVEVHRYEDRARGRFRIAFTGNGRLIAALFVAPEPVAVARTWLAAQIGAEAGTGVLSGQPGAETPDAGAVVCACFNVGVNTIAAAIASGRCLTVAEIGAALNAGTNCGSCRPELAQLILRYRPQRLAAE